MFEWFKKKTREVNFKLNVPKSESGISEPVISIVRSFSEKGRWKIKADEHPMTMKHYGGYSFTVTDTKTGEVYNIKSNSFVNSYRDYFNYMLFPQNLKTFNLPSWLTEAEREYVKVAVDEIAEKINQRFKVIEDRSRDKDRKQAKINQDKERQRLVDIYCNKGSQM